MKGSAYSLHLATPGARDGGVGPEVLDVRGVLGTTRMTRLSKPPLPSVEEVSLVVTSANFRRAYHA